MKNFILLLLLAGLNVSAQINPVNITIARDSFGIPHIFAPTDPEVAYGIAWAHAEDDFGTLQLVVLSGKAKLGTGLGKKGSRRRLCDQPVAHTKNSRRAMDYPQP
ncbi:MAG: penicillin acylase family protein [Bacteroidota bacterium]|nr:penicillin acylase family protein [Bacteroidota bacterium]